MLSVRLYAAETGSTLPLPLFATRLSCGFTSPAEDYIDQRLDLNEHLIHNPDATFFARAIGDSMVEANLHPDDIVIVDRSLEARNGSVVLATLNGEFVIKRYQRTGEKIVLVPENKRFPVREVRDGEDFMVWGVVTYTVHKHL